MKGQKSDAVDAARRLLANRHRHGTEGNVQSDVEALLRAIAVGTINSHYQIGRAQADIYLPNRRAFVEVKPHPKALDPEKLQSRDPPESPRQQLDRYVVAEIQDQLAMQPTLPGFSDDIPDIPWTGIVTDGEHWHVYRYPHESDATGELVCSQTFANEARELAEFLKNTLGSKMVGKEWIPENPGALFSDLKGELDDLYRQLPRKAAAPTSTKKKLWFDMVRTSGMVPDTEAGMERLFLAHSFLIVVVRLVSRTLTGPLGGDEWSSFLRDGFASWVLDFDLGRKWAKRVRDLVDAYDWRMRRGDVLRDLYQSYVDTGDRKVFGEFYTPDWLAALMVEHVLDDNWLDHATAAALAGDVKGVGVLDPACGSGTFLYHAALRILFWPSVKALRPVERANVVTALVNGMDIHPVAVEIARVNLERALPGEPTEGASAFRVFLGDSLQTATRGALMFGHTSGTILLTTPKGNQVHIPMTFAMSPSFAENMRRMVNAAVEQKPLPPGIANDRNRAELESCQAQLREVVAMEGDSVWTWYVINLAGPHLIAERKIDRIVANPPWVKLSDIQVDERKRAMENIGTSLGLQAGGKQAPHLDIASFFILRARELYAANPGRDPAAWLVKKSALRSGQWDLFRKIHAKTLAQSVDLQDLNPFHGGDATRCCLLMEHRHMRDTCAAKMRAVATTRRKPATHELLESAKGKIKFVETPDHLPKSPSEYFPVTSINEGATILPHVLALIAFKRRDAQAGWVRVETQQSGKKPWDKVPSQKGKVPEGWLRKVHMSRNLLPYMVTGKTTEAIVPVTHESKPHSDPGRHCPFWKELDEIYDVHRGRGMGTPKTLIERFDFAGKLSVQPLRPIRGRRMVLHPKSADIMRAARTHAGSGVVNETLYWLITESSAEARYLVAILNAACLRRAFAESRESGRDFHLHPWRKVPIPRYDAAKPQHRRLAELCRSAEKTAARQVAVELGKRPALGQPGLSKAVRKAVMDSKEGREIERIAAQLLPAQADPRT